MSKDMEDREAIASLAPPLSLEVRPFAFVVEHPNGSEFFTKDEETAQAVSDRLNVEYAGLYRRSDLPRRPDTLSLDGLALIEQRDPDASIERPDWPRLLHGHTKDFVEGMNDLVVVTRQSAKLGGQYIRKAMQDDYYHTYDAAGDELLDASHKCALTLKDFVGPPAALAARVAQSPPQKPNRPRKLEVAVTREGRTLVGYSNEDENGGFSSIGDITDQLPAPSTSERSERKS